YVPEKRILLPDVDQNEQQILLYHSEKLAIAFGLIIIADWVSLKIVKSHRICSDTDIMQLSSKPWFIGREIVVRDASRFHHFKYGNCCCSDYASRKCNYVH
ncbi:DYW_deaminase domain-containing protein, partial [Cephalotus follicularis]